MKNPDKIIRIPAAFIFLFILFSCPAAILSSGSLQTPVPDVPREIVGTVVDRQEILDRRPNSLMGRPDILEEIILTVRSEKTGVDVEISIKGHESLIKYRMITVASMGVFHVTGDKMPYTLVGFEPLRSHGDANAVPAKTVNIPPKPKATKTPYGELEIEKTNAALIIKSSDLQEKAVRLIGKKYGMKNASFISMKTFSGPEPPPGGNIYWGVKGQVNGVWHVWQYGYGLRKATGLEDPQRYNKCNSPDTMITTPYGSVPIKDLKTGNLVMSSGKIVPIIKTSKVRAIGHKVCRVQFDDGTILVISPGHPLAGGGIIRDLKAGDEIDGRRIVKSELIAYTHDYTYDILPGSPSGTYFAGGVGLGSTLAR